MNKMNSICASANENRSKTGNVVVATDNEICVGNTTVLIDEAEWTLDVRQCFYPAPPLSQICVQLAHNDEIQKQKELDQIYFIHSRVRKMYEMRDLLKWKDTDAVYMNDVEEHLELNVAELRMWLLKNETIIRNMVEEESVRACGGVRRISDYFKIINKP